MTHSDWPSLFAGLIVLLYWWQLLEVTIATRKATAAADRMPPGRVGRLLRLFWYPNVVAWVVIPIASAFPGTAEWSGLSRLWDDPLTQWASTAVAAIVYYVTLICWQEGVWRIVPTLQCVLVTLTFLASPTHLMALVALVQIGFLQWETWCRSPRLLSGTR